MLFYAPFLGRHSQTVLRKPDVLTTGRILYSSTGPKNRTDNVPETNRVKRMTSKTMTAAMCTIGDEILSGKVQDTNTCSLAKQLFNIGIDLRRVEVIPDDEDEISQTIGKLSAQHDFVFTSGGIGPTHDDITYQSIAKAFNIPLAYHQPTLDRMVRVISPREPGLNAASITTPRKKMALLPTDAQIVYPSEDLWVPIVIVKNVHILPGIPFLFNKMMNGYHSELVQKCGNVLPYYRVEITTEMKESDIADALTEAQTLAGKRIKIGSYPQWPDKQCVHVSFVSTDLAAAKLLAEKVARDINGSGWTESINIEGTDEQAKTQSTGDAKENGSYECDAKFDASQPIDDGKGTRES